MLRNPEVRSAPWPSLGVFREKFAAAYYEEVEFCVHLYETVFHTFYQPDAAVLHVEHNIGAKREVGYLIIWTREAALFHRDSRLCDFGNFCRHAGRVRWEIDYRLAKGGGSADQRSAL